MDEAGPSSGRKRAKKEYVPKPGTANYALLVTLYMVWVWEARGRIYLSVAVRVGCFSYTVI